MEHETDISIERDGKRLCLRVDFPSESDDLQSIRLEGHAYGVEECELRAVKAVEPLLRHESANLLTFFHEGQLDAGPTVIVALPADGQVVYLDEREPTEEFLDATNSSSDASVRDGPPVPVAVTVLVEAILDWIDNRLVVLDPETYQHVFDAYDEASALYEHFQEHGSLDGYEWVPSDEQIEETLFGYGADERVVDYLRRHDMFQEIVEELLTEVPDAETAEVRFRDLLNSKSEVVFERTIDALRARDDLAVYEDRIADQLLMLIYTGEYDRAAEALPLLEDVGTEYVSEKLCAELDPDLTEDPDMRAGMARALGKIGYSECRETLVSVSESDPSEAVREAAAAALERIDS